MNLSRLLDPRGHLRAMPDPDPRCKVYDFAETVQLFRNHERQFELSRGHHESNWPMKATTGETK